MRHNFNLRTTSDILRKRVKLDGNVSFMRQTVNDKPVPGGFYMNPLVGLYRFPRGVDITPYRENFEVYDADRKLYVQDWIAPSDDFEQNPYWVVNRIRSKSLRNRIMASLSADWRVTGWLHIKARANVDHFSDKVRQKFWASTAPALAGANGRYVESSFAETLFNGEVLALFDKRLSDDWKFSATLGTGLNDRTVNSLRIDSKTASLYYPNIFNVANIVMNSSAYVDEQIDARRQTQSLFATASFKYAESLNLEVTGRNDWASTLAYTDHENSGFFLLFGRGVVGDRQVVQTARVGLDGQGPPDLEPRGQRYSDVHYKPESAHLGGRRRQCRRCGSRNESQARDDQRLRSRRRVAFLRRPVER